VLQIYSKKSGFLQPKFHLSFEFKPFDETDVRILYLWFSTN